jgi:cytochrome c oxidase subunit III
LSTEAHAERLTGTEWDGGALPYRVGHRKLGMWLFIVSDAMTFTAMLIAYSYARASSEAWPTPFKFSPSILFSTTMTLCLLASSFTMVMAVRASALKRLKSARRWIVATMVGGTAFLVLHIIEWLNLIGEGLRPFGVKPGSHFGQMWAERWPSAPPLFGASFFSITGLHMFHVLTGVLYLGFIALRIGKTRHEDVEISGLYWHFVDLVWMFVFPLIYLMSVDMTGGIGGGSH